MPPLRFERRSEASQLFSGARIGRETKAGGAASSFTVTSSLHAVTGAALAKEYVEEAGEQLALLNVVRDYSGQVDEFHDWFRRALLERHRDALRELEERQGELLRLWQEATGESVDTGRV
jgi:hypothetical protein